MSAYLNDGDGKGWQYAFKREFWKMNIDDEIEARQADVLKNNRNHDCTPHTQAWRELLNEAAGRLHGESHLMTMTERIDANEKFLLLLAWGQLP